MSLQYSPLRYGLVALLLLIPNICLASGGNLGWMAIAFLFLFICIIIAVIWLFFFLFHLYRTNKGIEESLGRRILRIFLSIVLVLLMIVTYIMMFSSHIINFSSDLLFISFNVTIFWAWIMTSAYLAPKLARKIIK